ncbi:NAD(P)-dependent oxidoreductase [Parasphingorhabdus pacifica]
MRILVADAFPQEALAELAQLGHVCAYEPDTTTDQLADELAGYEVLVVRSTKVSATALEKAGDLRMVIRAGSGTNTIDSETASRHGIRVCNVPGRNADAVAELAFGLLLALDRRIPDNVADLRAGQWNKRHYSKATGIRGRQLGVLGLGEIGMAFAERAAAFGSDVHAVEKSGRDERTLQRARALGMRFHETVVELVQACDVLSLHLPATETTRSFLDRDLLMHVHPGSIIVNTARSELIDEDALIEAMDDKDIRAGIDVFADEPGGGTGTIDSRLATHPNVYGTHHIGASTEQAQHAVASEVVHMIDAFAAGRVLHCVNADGVPGPRSGEFAPTGVLSD